MKIEKPLQKARQLWRSGDRQLDKHNRRAWVRAMRRLGDQWVLTQPVRRVDGR
jgi:hypothetical protein